MSSRNIQFKLSILYIATFARMAPRIVLRTDTGPFFYPKIRWMKHQHCIVSSRCMLVLPSSTTEERLGAHVFFRVRGGRCGRDTSCCTRTPRWGVVLRLSLWLSFPWQLRCDSSQTLESHATFAPPCGSVGCVGLPGFHFADLEVVFEVVFVPETWATGMAATIFQLTVKQRFRNPLVVHTDHMSCPAHLRVYEERFYACKSTLL